jgi:hypothetical protein
MVIFAAHAPEAGKLVLLGMLLEKVTPLSRTIAHVVGAGPEKKVIGINAATHVTLVADLKAPRDVSPVQFPAHAVGIQGGPERKTGVDSSVPLRVKCAGPQPAAAIWLRDKLVLKAISEGARAMRINTLRHEKILLLRAPACNANKLQAIKEAQP